MGCVQMMGGKKENEYGEGTRKFVRKDGSLSIFNPLALRSMEVRGEYGRYLTYRYFRVGNNFAYEWTAELDCEDYTANWDGDKGKEKGWRNLNTSKKESSIEAKKILDEFCPQMNRLVKEEQSGTKEYYRYDITASGGGGGGGSSSSGGYKYNSTQNQLNQFKNRYEMDKLDRQRNELNKKIYDSNQKYRYQSPY
jgi:hypothetical protein